MNPIVKKALNRGAPIDTPILIDLYKFFQIFDYKEELLNEYKDQIKEIVGTISNIMDMYGGDFTLPVYATISIENNNSKILRFSGENYYATLAYLLTGPNTNKIMDTPNDMEICKVLKEELSKVQKEEELKINFPNIYKLYSDRLKEKENLLELDKIMDDKNIPLTVRLEQASKIVDCYKQFYLNFNLEREQQFAKKFTLDTFLKRLIKAIEAMIENSSEIILLYYNHVLELNSFTKEDEDKLNLYMAVQFMEEIEKEDEHHKQRYLFYLTNYFKENVETEVTRVKIKVNNKKITPLILYKRYQKILLDNPDLLAIDFSGNDFRNMTKEETEEFIVAYLSELSANWELIPREDTSVEKSIRSIAKRNYRNISLEERKQKEKKLIDLYMEKKKFYDSTDPYFRIKGKQTFDGYVGYIYKNSIVVLEKYYDNCKKQKIANNEAIYIMDMKDFYELSQYTKSYLIANHLCNRVIHKGSWQERVLQYINQQELTSNPTEYTKKLIDQNKVFIKEKKL